MVNTGSEAAAEARREAQRLKVFISYSRSDSRFASELLAGLAYDGGFEALIDSHSIHEGEQWKARIAALIADADAVVVILSPHWLTSPICHWELDEAWRLSKRIIPVQPDSLDGIAIPPRLAAINYVRFDQPGDGTQRLFMDGMSALRRALVTDLAWVREHTRLLTKAAEWDAAGRIANRMLSGTDITSAKQWLDRRPSGAPTPTELHRDYIAASEQAEVARLSAERQRAEMLQRAYIRARRALIVASVAALAAAGAGAVAYTLKLQAQRSEQQAAEERDAALIVQSRHLADIAEQQLQAGDAETAMLLALAGLPDYRAATAVRAAATASRPYVAETEGRLTESHFANRERLLLAGHTGGVLGLAVTSDGKRVATGGADQTARIWDAATGHEIASIKRDDGPVNSVLFSADGARIITASGGKAHVADSLTGKPILDLEGHRGDVLCLAISADGRLIATGSDDNTARIWDAATGKEIATLTGHAGPITGIALNADGTVAVTGSSDATAVVWDVAQRKQVAMAKDHTLAVTSVALSADGTRFATGSVDRSIRLWSTAGAQLQSTIANLDQPVASLAFDPRARHILMGAPDGTLRLLDTTTGREAQRLAGHTAGVTGAIFSADGQLILSSSKDGTSRVWGAIAGRDSIVLGGHTGAVTSVAMSADGRRAVTGSRDKTARIWGNDVAKPLVLGSHGGDVSGVAISRDGRTVVTGSYDRLTRVWDGGTGALVRELSGPTGPVSSIAISQDGRLVATGSEDRTVLIWKTETGEQIAALKPFATRVTSVEFTPSGEYVLAGAGTTARLWEVASGKQVAMFTGHTGSVLAVAISPDGRLAASAGRDATVRLLDLATRQPTLVFRAANVAATSVAFSSDNRRLVSGWTDGRVRVWDVVRNELLATVKVHDAAVTALALTSDGGRMISGASNGSAQVTTMFNDTAALVRRAEAEATRCLTVDQLTRYHLGRAPPRWCITGTAHQTDLDAATWQPLWPYQSRAWRDWLTAADRGAVAMPPGS